jgi:hypothetical protein
VHGRLNCRTNAEHKSGLKLDQAVMLEAIQSRAVGCPGKCKLRSQQVQMGLQGYRLQLNAYPSPGHRIFGFILHSLAQLAFWWKFRVSSFCHHSDAPCTMGKKSNRFQDTNPMEGLNRNTVCICSFARSWCTWLALWNLWRRQSPRGGPYGSRSHDCGSSFDRKNHGPAHFRIPTRKLYVEYCQRNCSRTMLYWCARK